MPIDNRLALYLCLLLLHVPLFWTLIRYKLFYAVPLYTTYVASYFLLNVLGSFIVLHPEYSLYSARDFYSTEFISLLFLQSVLLYVYLPIHYVYSRRVSPVQYRAEEEIVAKKVVVLSMVASAFFVSMYWIRFGAPPLMSAELFSGHDELTNQRSDGLGQLSQVWLYRIGFYAYPQIALTVAFLLSWRTRRLQYFAMLLVVAPIALGLSASFLHKTPLILVLFSIMLASAILRGRVRLGTTILSAATLTLAISAWYVLYSSETELDAYTSENRLLITAMANRIFAAYSINLAAVIPIVDSLGYLQGRTIINPAGVFPYEVVNLSALVHMEIFGFEGMAPPPAIGYGYADFGWIGAVLVVLFINLAILFLQKMLNLIQSGYVCATLTAYLCIRVLLLPMSSSIEVFLSPGEVLALLGILVIILSGKIKLGRRVSTA